jgi:hypothetical protein
MKKIVLITSSVAFIVFLLSYSQKKEEISAQQPTTDLAELRYESPNHYRESSVDEDVREIKDRRRLSLATKEKMQEENAKEEK